MQGFALSKWYADCISDDGTAVIIYHAQLRWRSAAIHYSSLLTHTPGVPSKARFSLRKCDAPAMVGDAIRWESEAWDATGKWSQLGKSQLNLLFQSGEGALDWHCIAPRATAAVKIGSAPVLRGWGYVEHLTLTMQPWHLPIKRLRWGRFVNATDALVWIDWEGAHITRVVYLNGVAVSASIIDDTQIALTEHAATLHLHDSTVIRDGQLGSTALAVIPHLERIFPASILMARECKWLSRAVLRRPGLPDSVGMAIHEVVEWP